MTIHSYRRVLQVRRHIHTFQWRDKHGKQVQYALPAPVPVIAVAYFACLEIVFFIASRLPLIGAFSHLPYWVWWLIPFWLTYLALTMSFDGRMPHLWVRSWITYRLRPKRTRAGLAVNGAGSQQVGGKVRWYSDEHHPALSRCRIVGPAMVHFNTGVRFVWRVKGFTVRPSARGPEFYQVEDRLEVKP